MKVYFIIHLDWEPIYLFQITLVCLLRVCLDEVNMWISRLSKAHCPPQCGWTSYKQLKIWTGQKTNPPLSKTESSLPDYLQTGTSAFSCLGLKLKHWVYLCLKPDSLLLKLHHWFSWFLGLQIQTGTIQLAPLRLQLANSLCKSWDLPASIITQANSL